MTLSSDRLSFARRLRRHFWPVPIDREIADELAAHIALQTKRYIDVGMSEDEARREAESRFGDYDSVRDECREIRTDMEEQMAHQERLQDLRMDLKLAVRRLRRGPLFALVAILTIAIAVGANTAIFSVIDAVLLRGLPYRYADRAEMIWNTNAQTTAEHMAVAAPEYFDLKEELRAHDAVAAIYPQPSALVADGGEPERLNAYVVTPNLFDLLGATPSIGRGFGGTDGQVGATRVAILSHALWTRRFGGDPTIVGRAINLAGTPRTVIGIMPPGIRFPDAPLGFMRDAADLWIPSTLESARSDQRGNQIMAVVARRSPGMNASASAADLNTVAALWRTTYPDRYASESSRHWRLDAVSVRDEMVGSVRVGLLAVAAAAGFVLLIACVNVTNLLLARGATRQREVAIHLALGARRGRLIRQLLTESALLGVLGGVMGLLLAWIGIRILLLLDNGHLPRLGEASIDLKALVFSFGLSIVTGLLVGLVPALQQSSRDLRPSLSDSARGSTDSRAHHRFRISLVVAQMAMALVVLVGAGLLARSFSALQHVKPGFVSNDVLTMQLTVPRAKYDSASKVLSFYQDLVVRTAHVPGVVEASGGFPIPMSTDGWSGSFNVDGEPAGPNDPLPHAEYGVAMPGFFHALRIPLIAGRDFASTDTRAAPSVVIVDEALARAHWPGQSAIGKRLNPNRDAGRWATVIGVVGHVHKSGPQSDGEPQIYLPHAQSPQTTLSIVVRTNAPANAVGQPLRALVRSLDANLPISRMQPLEEIVDRATARERFNTVLLGAFGFAALLLASVGLYGVMTFLVAQRTREIGIRMALGGEPGSIRSMVLREGLMISGAGLAIGIAVSLVATRAIAGLLFGIAPNDAETYVGIGALLFIVGAVASYGPAHRATRVDPLVALRE
ncbi:MAG TPA: ABC transporter permease [Gemmatimonadaceae bacterium]|jgi:putative ABC transport system permease protein